MPSLSTKRRFEPRGGTLCSAEGKAKEPQWSLRAFRETNNQPSNSNSFHMLLSCSALKHSHSQRGTNQPLSTQHHPVLLLGQISASFTETSALLLWTVVNPASATSLRPFCHSYGEASGCRFSHGTLPPPCELVTSICRSLWR